MMRGLSFIDALQLLFIAFKLAGIITWSWWIVLIPSMVILASVVVSVVYRKDGVIK